MSTAVIPETAIRPMQAADLHGVQLVEQAAYNYPWSRAVFRDCLLAGYYSLVLDINRSVSGYAIMSIGAAEAHVLNLCVHPGLRRLGYGRRLLNALLFKAQDAAVRQVFLEVRPSNRAAINLYLSAGFVEVGIRPAYYQAKVGRENAVVLSLALAPSD
ncbi:MAG: ribosomal protein S18-alanine N-acetyltransferase [Gammaproteobacteria bacterium]|jgi:ribosomal-protein-alanine N-acetyltransferase